MPKYHWLAALAVGSIASAPAHADPISASLTAVVGAFASGGIAATAGTFLIGTAVSVGLSYLSRAFTKKPSGGSASSSATTLQISLDANRSRVLVLGERAVAGSLHYFCRSGPQQENLDLIIVLADHEIDSVQKIWVNDLPVATDLSSGFQNVPEFHDKWGFPMISMHLYKGTLDQPADYTTVAASGGQWTEDHRLLGCAYVHVRVILNPETFNGQVPTFKFLLRGAKLYDPRRDSTAPGGLGPQRWGQPATYTLTDSLEIARYNFLRGIFVGGQKRFGVGLAVDEIDMDKTLAGIAACEEPILRRDGMYEPRYRVAAVIDADEPWRDVLAKFSLACAGSLPDLSGRYALIPGVAQVPVISFTDGDLIAGSEITGSSHRPFDELVSEVTGSWASPETQYDITALPARYSSSDEEEDGGFPRSASYDLSYVASQSQGQRCLEIFRRLVRRQITHKVTLRRRYCVLEAGDWLLWSSDKYGYIDREFRVEAVQSNDDLTVTAQLRQIDSGVYAWSVTDEQDPDNPSDLPSGGPGSVVVTGLTVQTAQVNGIDGTQVPGLYVTWTPITDLTVYALVLEYRRLGDVPWQAYQASEDQVRGGAATITAGVLGGELYQVRATPLTSPRRVVDVSAIVSTSSNTVEVVVQRALVAVVAEGVEPGRVTNDMLDGVVRDKFDQARRDNDALTIALMAERADTEAANEIQTRATNALRADVAQGLNTATASITHLENVVVGVEESVAELSVELNAEIAGVAATLVVEQNTRASADGALSEEITDLTAQVGTDIAGIHVELEAQASATAVVASETRTLFAQDLQAADAATIALMAEMSARDEDTTALRRGLNASFAGISEVRKAGVENGEAIASISTTLVAEVDGLTALITTESEARTNGDETVASHAETLIAQESATRGAAVSAEALARTNADGVLASNITSAVATETSNRNAAVTAEQTARINADNALSSNIITAQATANFATAFGQYGVVTVAGVGGAVASFVVALNAGAIGSGMRLDAMSGGSSRVVFNVGAFFIEDPTAGVRNTMFSYSGGQFFLGGNVRVNGNLLVTGTITSLEISEAANLGLQGICDANTGFGMGVSGWTYVGTDLALTTSTRGGYTSPMVHIRWDASATNLTGTTSFVDVQFGFRVLCNGVAVYEQYTAVSVQLQAAQGLSRSFNDFFLLNTSNPLNFFQIQVRHSFSGSGNAVGSFYAKVGSSVYGR